MGKGNYTFIEGRITVDLGYCSSIVKNIWTYSVRLSRTVPIGIVIIGRERDKTFYMYSYRVYNWNIHVGSGNTIQIILWIFTFCWLMSTSAKLKQMLLFLNLLCPSVNVMDCHMCFVMILGHFLRFVACCDRRP